MTGLKTGLAAVVLLGVLDVSAPAQGVVPGGWAPQVGFQSFGASGVSGGVAYGVGGFGGGFSPYGGYQGFGGYGGGGSPYGMGVSPYGMGVSGYGMGSGSPFNQAPFPGMSAPLPQTFNGTGSLIGAIRQTTRKSNRR